MDANTRKRYIFWCWIAAFSEASKYGKRNRKNLTLDCAPKGHTLLLCSEFICFSHCILAYRRNSNVIIHAKERVLLSCIHALEPFSLFLWSNYLVTYLKRVVPCCQYLLLSLLELALKFKLIRKFQSQSSWTCFCHCLLDYRGQRRPVDLFKFFWINSV